MAKYKCKDCDRVFGRKQGLAVHRGVKHAWKAYDMPALSAELLGLDKDVQYDRVELPMQPEGARRDMVNHPPHYTFGKYEVLDVLQDWFSTEPLLWQTVKYLARAGRKGSMLEDLRKAEFYLKRRIEKELENGTR